MTEAILEFDNLLSIQKADRQSRKLLGIKAKNKKELKQFNPFLLLTDCEDVGWLLHDAMNVRFSKEPRTRNFTFKGKQFKADFVPIFVEEEGVSRVVKTILTLSEV